MSKSFKLNAAVKFPSPLGDYVFNLGDLNSFKETWDMFPSPLGDYVFNHMQEVTL